MRILVCAASRHEATNEVAKAIADTLERAGNEVEVRRPEQVGHLTGFDAVVLGSAIYAGRWLKPARDLVERTSGRMRTLPVWLFSTGPIGDPLMPTEPPVDVEPMIEQSGAREHRLFGGRLDRRELGIGEKLMVRMVHAPDGDYRPWREIGAWAEEIASALRSSVPAPLSVSGLER